MKSQTNKMCGANYLYFQTITILFVVSFNGVKLIRIRGNEYNTYDKLVSTFKNLSVVPNTEWVPVDSDTNRSVLHCPQRCYELEKQDLAHQEGCCLCFSAPSWRYPTDKTKPLEVDYIRRNGIAKILKPDHLSHDSLLRLIHTHGYLSSLPQNICSFPTIVEIVVKYNKISDIGNITCLLQLDTLDISHNNIKYIRNTSFTGLSELRVLNASYNKITQLDLMTTNGPTLQIFRADFSNNNLSTLEISNFISEKNFCNRDFSKNKIQKFVNTNGFELHRQDL